MLYSDQSRPEEKHYAYVDYLDILSLSVER